LPKKLTKEVKKTIGHLRETPFACAIRYKNIRIANLNIFPYPIHYFLREETVVVIAIHHTAINPEK
jgi:hypothetical protein